MAAEAVLKIREALPVRLHLILPCKGQSDRWHVAEKRRYREILKQADTAEMCIRDSIDGDLDEVQAIEDPAQNEDRTALADDKEQMCIRDRS